MATDHPYAHLEGPALLAGFLDELKADKNRRGQEWLAGIVGVGQPAISLWKNGDKRPEPHHRKILKLVASIPESAWLTDDEKTAIRLACKRGGINVPSFTGTEG